MTGHDHSDADDPRESNEADAVDEQKIRYNPLKRPDATESSLSESERIRWNPLEKPPTGL